MASYTKRTGSWRAQIRLKGNSESKEFSTKAAAQAWALDREREIRSVADGALPRHSLQEALDRYKRDVAPLHAGERWEAIRLDALATSKTCPLPTRRPIAEVTTAALVDWRDARLKEVAPATVARELTLLGSVFEHARREWQWLRVNPMRDVRKPKEPVARRRGVSSTEIGKITGALGHPLIDNGIDVKALNFSHQVAIAFLFAIETAMRAGEILGLTWDCVHDDFVHIKKSKNGDARDVPLSKEAARLLSLLPRTNDDAAAPCFSVSSASLDALFRKAKTKAKCESVHFHDSRSEAITRLSKKLDVLELARMVGHRDPKSLMFYYAKSASDIAKKL